VIAYGCLIKKKEARREHLDYIYRGLMTQHAKVHCNRGEILRADGGSNTVCEKLDGNDKSDRSLACEAVL
jgi:hypothetical protein